tara:strand:+ start:550 stop:975 length:426 start_codon:yes stop_codon:yes gene_type:complete
MTELDYAGDLDPQKAWSLLEQNKDCYLIDCRTTAEWNFVGVPDLNSIGKNVLFIEWQTYPLMEKNNNFLQEIKNTGISKDSKFIFICRSGARSRSAAEFLTHQGYNNCYNFSEGFEGNHDSEGHRGKVSGWKQANLPWKQG